MDWIDVALIVSGVGVCGVLHLAAFVLVRRERAETETLQQTREAVKGSPNEVK